MASAVRTRTSARRREITRNFIRQAVALVLADVGRCCALLCYIKTNLKNDREGGAEGWGGEQEDDGPNRSEQFDRLIRQDVVTSESASVAPTIPLADHGSSNRAEI